MTSTTTATAANEETAAPPPPPPQERFDSDTDGGNNDAEEAEDSGTEAPKSSSNGGGKKKKKSNSDAPVTVIFKKKLLTEWAYENDIRILDVVFPPLNTFVLSLDWGRISRYGAPTQTPDAGFIFSRVKKHAVSRFDFPDDDRHLKTLCRNLSFIMWAALHAAKAALNEVGRKRITYELLEALLKSCVNCSSAAIGALPSTGEPAPVLQGLREKRKAEKRKLEEAAAEDGENPAAAVNAPYKMPKKAHAVKVTAKSSMVSAGDDDEGDGDNGE